MDIFINMRQFLAILWTFELLLHFDQFSSNLQIGDKLCTNQNHITIKLCTPELRFCQFGWQGCDLLTQDCRYLVVGHTTSPVVVDRSNPHHRWPRVTPVLYPVLVYQPQKDGRLRWLGSARIWEDLLVWPPEGIKTGLLASTMAYPLCYSQS